MSGPGGIVGDKELIRRLAEAVIRLAREIDRRSANFPGVGAGLPRWALQLEAEARKALGQETVAEMMARWDQESKDEAPF